MQKHNNITLTLENNNNTYNIEIEAADLNKKRSIYKTYAYQFDKLKNKTEG